MITVKVNWESTGMLVEGKEVALYLKGLLTGGVTEKKWTDSKGEAHFDVAPGDGIVYVSGSKAYEGHLSGRVVVYI